MPRRYPKRSARPRRKGRKKAYKKKRSMKPPNTTPIRYRKVVDDILLSTLVNGKVYTSHVLGHRTDINVLFNAYDAVFFDEAADTVATKYLGDSAYTITPDIASIEGLKIYIKKMTCTLTFRNNYNLPADLDLAWLTCKQTTGTTPSVHLLADFDQQGIPHTTATASPLYNWKMRNPVGKTNKFWRMKWSKKYRLLPGQEITVVAVLPPRWCKSEEMINDTNPYQPRYCGFFMMGLSGIIGHEGDASDLGYMPAKLDLILQRDFQWCFPNNLQRDTKMLISNTLGATDLEVAMPGGKQAVEKVLVDVP